MAVKIAYLLLTLAVACSYLDGGVGGHSELHPGFRLGLAAPSQDDPVPKIEPMAMTRVQRRSLSQRRFLPRNLPLNRPNMNFRFKVGPGAYRLGSFRQRSPFGQGPGDFIIRHPDVIRRPILIEPLVNVPTNFGRVIFVDPIRPGRFHPGPLHPGLRPGMNNGPFYHNQRPVGGFHPGANGPVHWVPPHPELGGNMHPGGITPMQPNHGRPDFNRANSNARDGNQKKDLPEGTVGVTVAAINQTEEGSVHANVTVFVVPKEGDNKETLQTAAKSVLDGIFNKEKGQEQRRKGSNNLEDVLNRIDLH